MKAMLKNGYSYVESPGQVCCPDAVHSTKNARLEEREIVQYLSTAREQFSPDLNLHSYESRISLNLYITR